MQKMFRLDLLVRAGLRQALSADQGVLRPFGKSLVLHVYAPSLHAFIAARCAAAKYAARSRCRLTPIRTCLDVSPVPRFAQRIAEPLPALRHVAIALPAHESGLLIE